VIGGLPVTRFFVYPWFGTFASSTVHGVMAGTDSGGVVGFSLYLIPSVALALLLVVRVALVRSSQSPARSRPPAPDTSHASPETTGPVAPAPART